MAITATQFAEVWMETYSRYQQNFRRPNGGMIIRDLFDAGARLIDKTKVDLSNPANKIPILERQKRALQTTRPTITDTGVAMDTSFGLLSFNHLKDTFKASNRQGDNNVMSTQRGLPFSEFLPIFQGVMGDAKALNNDAANCYLDVMALFNTTLNMDAGLADYFYDTVYNSPTTNPTATKELFPDVGTFNAARNVFEVPVANIPLFGAAITDIFSGIFDYSGPINGYCAPNAMTMLRPYMEQGEYNAINSKWQYENLNFDVSSRVNTNFTTTFAGYAGRGMIFMEPDAICFEAYLEGPNKGDGKGAHYNNEGNTSLASPGFGYDLNLKGRTEVVNTPNGVGNLNVSTGPEEHYALWAVLSKISPKRDAVSDTGILRVAFV